MNPSTPAGRLCARLATRGAGTHSGASRLARPSSTRPAGPILRRWGRVSRRRSGPSCPSTERSHPGADAARPRRHLGVRVRILLPPHRVAAIEGACRTSNKGRQAARGRNRRLVAGVIRVPFSGLWAWVCSRSNPHNSPLRKPRSVLPRQATAARGFVSPKSPKKRWAVPFARSFSQSALPLAVASAKPTKTPNAPKSARYSLLYRQAGTQVATTIGPIRSPLGRTPPRHRRRKCPRQTTQSSRPPRFRSHTPAKRRNVARLAQASPRNVET